MHGQGTTDSVDYSVVRFILHFPLIEMSLDTNLCYQQDININIKMNMKNALKEGRRPHLKSFFLSIALSFRSLRGYCVGSWQIPFFVAIPASEGG